jgi:hypothetical protein
VELPIFLCFYVLYAGTYKEGEEDILFWSPNCLKDMTIMYEKSRVSDLSACILDQEGTTNSTPIERQEEDQSEKHEEEEVTPSSSIGKNLKRKGKSSKKSPFKKMEEPNEHEIIH